MLTKAAMWTKAIGVAVLLASVGPAWAQGQVAGELRGRIEEIRDAELLLRGEDGRLHVVDTAAMPSAELGMLNPGDTIVIATKADGVRGPIGHHVKQRTPARGR
jgi:hypothetical protein